MDLNLKDVDEDLKDIKVSKKPSMDNEHNSTPEGILPFFIFSVLMLFLDDVAIAEAIAQVEKELQKEKTAENSVWYLGLIIVGGLVTSRILSSFFTKN